MNIRQSIIVVAVLATFFAQAMNETQSQSHQQQQQLTIHNQATTSNVSTEFATLSSDTNDIQQSTQLQNRAITHAMPIISISNTQSLQRVNYRSLSQQSVINIHIKYGMGIEKLALRFRTAQRIEPMQSKSAEMLYRALENSPEVIAQKEIVLADIERAHEVLQSFSKATWLPADVNNFVSFVKDGHIRDREANKIILKFKEKASRYWSDKNGILQRPTEYQEVVISLAQEALDELERYKANIYLIIRDVYDITAGQWRTSEFIYYPRSNNSYYENRIINNPISADIFAINELCAHGNLEDYQQAACMIEKYRAKSQSSGTIEINRAVTIMEALYCERFLQHYDVYGIDKQYHNDPTYPNIIASINHMRRWDPHPLNKDYFAPRNTLLNILNKHVQSSEKSIQKIVYALCDMHTKGPFETVRYLAHTLSTDHTDPIIQKAYYSFYTQSGLPRFFNLSSPIKISDVIHTHAYAQEREILGNLSILHARNPDMQIFIDGMSCIERVCNFESYSHEYYILSQAIMNAGLHFDKTLEKSALLHCKNLMHTPIKLDQVALQGKMLTMASNLAHILSRNDNHPVDKQASEFTLLELDTLYGAMIKDNSTQAHESLKLFLDAHTSEQLVVPISTRLEFKSLSDEITPGNLDLDFKITTVSQETIDLKTLQKILQDPSLGTDIREALIDTYSSATENQSSIMADTAHKLLDALTELQTYIDTKSKVTITELDKIQADVYNTQEYSTFDRYNSVATIQLLKKAINTAAHPLETLHGMIHGAAQLIFSVLKLASVDYEVMNKQDIDAFLHKERNALDSLYALGRLPRIEQFKIAIDAIADIALQGKIFQAAYATQKALMRAAKGLHKASQLKSVAQTPAALQQIQQFELSTQKAEHALSQLQLVVQQEQKALQTSKELSVENITAPLGKVELTLGETILPATQIAHLEKIEAAFKNGTLSSFSEPPISLLKNGNTIKELSSEVLGLKWRHIFSEDHINNGMMSLGNSQANIMSKLLHHIIQLDKENLLKIGDNTIIVPINKHKTLIRFNIRPDGFVQSIDGYNITKNVRLLGNVIRLD